MKNKEVLKRHANWMPIVVNLFKPFLKARYKIKFKRFDLDRSRQYMFLCTHALPIDPIFVDMSYLKPIYFVATEQILNLGLASKILQYFLNLTPISKGVADITTVKKLLRIKKEGGSIGVFPEGNTEYTGRPNWINPSIVKLIRMLALPLVFINSYGLSFCNTRWSIRKKRGKCGYFVRSVIEYEDYKDYSDEELLKLIYDKIDLRAYDLQEQVMYKYRGKKRAEGLERLLFVCPSCKTPFSTYSKDNHLHCNSCEKEFYYDEYGFLEVDGIKRNMDDLYTELKKVYLDFLQHQTGKKTLFSDVGILLKTTRRQRRKIGNIQISATTESFCFKINDEQFECKYGQFRMAVQGKRKIIIYPKDRDTLLIKFKTNISPLKYLITNQYYRYNSPDVDEAELALQHYGL